MNLGGAKPLECFHTMIKYEKLFDHDIKDFDRNGIMANLRLEAIMKVFPNLLVFRIFKCSRSPH